MAPRPGDVLVSHHSATAEHDISVVPKPPQLSCPTHDIAVARALELGRQLGVDVWLTEDLTHFIRLASNRPEV